ncbi:MAG: ComEC/Rec2 family competence protein [Defluviitaleaceae bacterium]|nr:ComEC/Rec2 family competence protein [Defluviitaleaceae bacterium]
MRRPILWSLGFLIVGIICGAFVNFPFSVFILAAVVASVVLYKFYDYKPLIFLAVFFMIGFFRVGTSLENHTHEPTQARFSGRVIDVGYTRGGNQRAVLRGTHPETGRNVRIMAYIRPHQRHLELGQEATIYGELLPLRRAENPGGYDQFRHLRPQKIDATIWPEEIRAGEIRRSPMIILREMRDAIGAVYDEILPPREAAVLKSMTLGDRLDLDRDLAELYRGMGIFHILSISGLHVTILMLAANKFFAFFMRERRAAMLALGVMVAYCLMTGAAIPTVRAVTMGGVLVGAKIFYREYDLLTSVAWACLALLIYEPLQLFGAGFQLSFGAVFGIGILTAPVERLLSRLKFPHGTEFWRNFRESLAVGIAVVSSTYIVFAYHFYEIPLYSLLGNLITMPTVALLLILGVIAGIVGLVSLPLATLLAGAVYYILRFYEATAIFFSNLPFAMLRTGGGNLTVAALGVAVLGTFAYMYHEFDDEIFARRRKIFFATACALIITVTLTAFPLNQQRTDLENYKIIRHRTDTIIISGYRIDEGERIRFGAPHGGESDLLRYLDMRGVNRAALLLTSPPLPADEARLARILPRVHTLYLPAHAEGATESLMNEALARLDLPENIVFLHDGDTRTGATPIRVHAMPMGRFEISFPETGDFSGDKLEKVKQKK